MAQGREYCVTWGLSHNASSAALRAGKKRRHGNRREILLRKSWWTAGGSNSRPPRCENARVVGGNRRRDEASSVCSLKLGGSSSDSPSPAARIRASVRLSALWCLWVSGQSAINATLAPIQISARSCLYDAGGNRISRCKQRTVPKTVPPPARISCDLV